MKAPQGTALGTLINSLRKQDVPIRIVGRSNAELTEVLNQKVAFDLKESPAREFFAEAFKSTGADVSVTDEEVVLMFRN